MKQNTNRVLSLILSIVMVLSLATVIPMAVSAEGAPVMDGVKDDLYTAEKMTKITTGYDIGVSGAVAPNTDKIELEVYYTWDAEFIYIFMDVKDPSATTGEDYFYLVNHKEIDNGFIVNDSHGSYIQFKADGSIGGIGGAVVPTEYKANRAAGSNNRSYELKYARNGNEEGFRISPAVSNGAYFVSYAGKFGEGLGSKQIMFENSKTWHEEALEKIVGEDNTIDAEKDDRYTDSKKVFVSNAFTGDHGMPVENKSGMSYTIWVAWDDEFNYIYAEADDPNATCTYECFYFKNNLDEFAGYIFAASGGGYIEFKNGTGSGTPAVLKSATKVETGKRKFEFKFERNPSATGFAFGLVGTPTGGYVVAHGNDYNTADHIDINYTDESTWVQDFSPQPEKPEDPVIGEALDGEKDARYTEDKCTVISTAYMGSGGVSIPNKYHIYTKLYYAWDETNNYIYFEVYDPDMTKGADILYYATNSDYVTNEETKQLNLFAAPGGGYLQFDTTDGSVSAMQDTGYRDLSFASKIGDGVRQYEVVIPKTEGAAGIMLSPVASREDGVFTVSYNTHYYIAPGKYVSYDNADNSWADTSKVDPAVLTDGEKAIADTNAAIGTLPADVNTLTLNDKEAVDAVTAQIDHLPAVWKEKLDADLVARHAAAVEKIKELQLEEDNKKVSDIETAIAALPENVQASDLEAIEALVAAVEALGENKALVNANLLKTLTAKYNRAVSFKAVVEVDGVKDAVYDQDDTWYATWAFRPWTSSDVETTEADSTATIQTACDGKYMYFYVQVNKATGIVDLDIPAATHVTNKYDSLTFYVDLDPLNLSGGAPYQDAEMAGDHMMWFSMFADGQILCSGNATAYINQIGALAHFREEKTYGFELRLPLIEGEESVKMSCCFSDPTWKEDETGTLKYVEEESFIVALGPTWAHNYTNYGEKFIEDYTTYYSYDELAAIIEALPDPETIVTDECKKQAKSAKSALALLKDEQKALISEDLLAKLDAVLVALENIVKKPDYVYGDLNEDGNQDAVDALMVLQIAVDKLQPTDTQLAAADVSGDGNINAEDALYILQKAVDKIDLYPVEK